ncbi:MAG: hypothetical protein NTV34_07885 [Proteobacteria bacterium]|nr:hypothetical protein [Pseudomonadota bacterium]
MSRDVLGVLLKTQIISLVVAYLTNSTCVYASGMTVPDAEKDKARPMLPVLSAMSNAYLPIYFGLTVGKTNPVSHTENDYESGVVGTSLHYRFFMHDQWGIGVAGGFKSLSKSEDLGLSYFVFSQDAYRLFRIYHPAWLGLGFKSMYMVGVQKVDLPYERNPNQPPQVGAGLNAALFYVISKNMLLNVELSRWRGTVNNKLHVLEFGVGFSHSI